MAAGDVIVVKESAFSRKGNYFDGTDDYVLHDAHAVARVAANDTVGTYSAWIYVNSFATFPMILSAGDNDSANESLQFFVTTTGQLKIKLQQAGATKFEVRETTGSVPLRTWIHVACVQDGVQPALYINGVAKVTTNVAATDLTMWYDEGTNCDRFAIGVLESNGTHTQDFAGAIGTVKYWSLALNANEIKAYYDYEAGSINAAKLTATLGSTRETALNAALQLNVTMADDGTTDSGAGADNGTLTGDAHYGGEISTWSQSIERNATGHAAEAINTFRDVDKYVSVIRRGD